MSVTFLGFRLGICGKLSEGTTVTAHVDDAVMYEFQLLPLTLFAFGNHGPTPQQ